MANTPRAQAIHIKQIRRFYHQLLLKEKNIAAAVSHVDRHQIDAQGSAGSIQSVLRDTPSVNAYQQNFGQAVPVITVRGVRPSQLAQTLDGVPLQDLISGGSGTAFLDNVIGSPVTLGQISGATVYPGVAPPDRQGFATLGGTIAYRTRKPSPKRSFELFGGYGSFNTSHLGFQVETGPLSAGIDAPRALLRYNQGYSSGYIDNTNQRYSDLLFSIVKPYGGGLSHLSATIIYNRAFGYYLPEPLPITLINQNSYTFNFPKSEGFNTSDNNYLTGIMSDQTYINPHMIMGGKLFVILNRSVETGYENPAYIQSSYNKNAPFPVNSQIPYTFYGASFGAKPYYVPGYFTYNPVSAFGSYTAGESASLVSNQSTTIGFAPTVNLFYGLNDITIGGLIAKESYAATVFDYGSLPIPKIVGYNSFALGGGTQRTIYSLYAQDRINLLNDHLHILPGVTFVGAFTNNTVPLSFFHKSYRLHNYGKSAEPYLGLSYDLPDHVVAYASYGKSIRFAPATDYSIGASGTTAAPNPETVHLYEAGLRYDTAKLYLNADIFYQKVNDAFSFFVNYAAGIASYTNAGDSQYKGYEASTKFFFNRHLEIFGNGSFIQANYLNNYEALVSPFEGHFGHVFGGDPIASVPTWLGNFGLQYNLGLLSARLSEQYTGQQFITAGLPGSISNLPRKQDTLEPGVPDYTFGLHSVPYYPNPLAKKALALGGAPPFPLFKLPGYLLTNILLTYRLPVHFRHIRAIKLSLNVQNLFGLHYFQHQYLFGDEFSNKNGTFQNTPDSAYAYIGPPRSIFVDATAKF